MRKLIIALTFCLLGLLGTIHTGNMGNEAGETSQGLHESSDTDLQSIELLAEITSAEVLPLIIFTHPNKPNYQMPEKLVKFELNEGRIAHGTEFASSDPGNQVFLCPKKNSAEECLVPTSFQGSEPLQCSSEPIPQLIKLDQPCGGGDMDNRIYIQAAYKICETESPVRYPHSIWFYDICYDAQLHKVVYTTSPIRSPGLLNLKLLTHERSVDYPIVFSNDPIFSNHPITRDMFAEEAGNLKKPQYRLKQFISESDMVFATWRKTTFNHFNYGWMQENLISLWDEINANIRSIAEKYSTSVFIVNTAIIDINSTSEDDNQLSNIWMKMALVMKLDPQQGLISTHGTAILMNNFLHENESLNNESLNNRHEAIEKYCIENLCIPELINKFTEIGGRIFCCPITPQILQHFPFKIEANEELHIPNVTVTDNQGSQF